MYRFEINGNLTNIIEISPSSINPSMQLIIGILPIGNNIPTGITCRFFHIGELFDEFDCEGGTITRTKSNSMYNFSSQLLGKREPGLYILKNIRITFSDIDEEYLLDAIIENTNLNLPLLSANEIKQKYDTITNNRKIRAEQGLGAGNNIFHFIFFIKNCLITHPLDLYDFVIEPFRKIGISDQASIIFEYLSKRKLTITINEIESMLFEYQHEPISIFIIPKLLANNDEEAWELAKKEIAILNNILSISRQSYGEIIATFVYKPKEKRFNIFPSVKLYRGNYMGGDISGENKTGLFKILESIRQKPKIQLYLSLFTTAMQEDRIEFRYFRLWSLLEIIASNQGYVGQPLLDWLGVQKISKKGKVLFIENKAEPLVFELFRRKFSSIPYQQSFGRSITQNTFEQLIKIWYRHRNCTCHNGGCFPDDTSICLRNDLIYINCNLVHEEMILKHGQRILGTDDYLSILEDKVRDILISEF